MITPGRWKFWKGDMTRELFVSVEKKGGLICRSDNPAKFPDAENEANMKAIAAVPELIDAAKIALNQLKRDERYDEYCGCRGKTICKRRMIIAVVEMALTKAGVL